MLKTGIENLKDGMKVVVEDMSKVLCGDVVGKSGQVLTITQEFNKGGNGWRLLNPDTGVYMYISPDEYKYVKVLNEGEDMQDFKVGDVVEIIAENDPYRFTGDHDIELGTKVTLLHHDLKDNTFLVGNGEGWEVWVEPQAMKKVEDLANCDNLVEKYPEGTLLKCLVGDLEWYNVGEVYEVGYCRTVGTDYGVIDKDGQVMMEATIYDYARNKTGYFDPTQWEVVIVNFKELYPEGTILKCINSELDFYEYGELYKVGFDKDGDYGVKDEDGDVMFDGRMVSHSSIEYTEGFVPDYWEVVELEKVKVEVAQEDTNIIDKYPKGTRLKCLADNYYRYSRGDIYEVGMDSACDYGVMDTSGDVMYDGRMYSEMGFSIGFDPDFWEVVEPKKVKAEEPKQESKQEPKFKVGDLVVRARAVGNMFTSYPVGTVMEVRSDMTIVGTYWCEGYTPHSEAEGQYVKEEELELASIEDIKKLTQEFVDKTEVMMNRSDRLLEFYQELQEVRRAVSQLEDKMHESLMTE